MKHSLTFILLCPYILILIYICGLFVVFYFIFLFRSCIEKARSARTFGLILGTLGRQGNIQLFDRLTALMEKHGRIVIPFLMAELNPAKLALIPHIDVSTYISLTPL